LDDLDHAPALGLRQRTGLHHADGVAHVGVVALVVHGELVRTPHRLLVERVPDLPVDLHQHGLVHLLGHDDTGPNLPCAPIWAIGLLTHAVSFFFSLRRRLRFATPPSGATASLLEPSSSVTSIASVV